MSTTTTKSQTLQINPLNGVPRAVGGFRPPPRPKNSTQHMLLSNPRKCISLRNTSLPPNNKSDQFQGTILSGTLNATPNETHSDTTNDTPERISFGRESVSVTSTPLNQISLNSSQSVPHRSVSLPVTPLGKSTSSKGSGLSHLGSRPKKTDSFETKTLVKQSLDSNTCTPKTISKLSRASKKRDGIRSDENNVTGTYGNDINIIEIDRIVIDKIKSEEDDKMSKLKSTLDIELGKIKKPQNRIERRNSIKLIKLYREQMDEIKACIRLNNYTQESKPLLEDYRKIGVKLEVVAFGKESVKPEIGEMTEEQEYRIMIIERYLEIVRKYVEINIFKKCYSMCNNCKADISLSSVNDAGMLECSVCGVESVTLAKSVSPDEESVTVNINVSNLKDYEDRENFYKAMVKYQGKQPNKFPSNLYDMLDEYFSSIGFPIGKEISEMPINEDSDTSIKTRGKSNRSLMLKALKDIGMSSFYEDINLLCRIYWGWVLPDLSELEDAIMIDYDLSQEVFERHKGDRKSCLNIQYRLWRHLSRRGHPCRPNNFKIIKTPEIIKYYERVWEIICDELGWDKPASLN